MTNKGKGKGKAVAGKAPDGKRKRGFDDDKTGGGRKRNNRGVLQFFEDAAHDEESDFSDFSDDDSDFSDDFSDEDFDAFRRMLNDPAKGQSSLPYVPKEEMVDEEEFDRMMEKRFSDPSMVIRFADEFDDDKLIDPSSIPAGAKDPIVWKVKCTVGRERLSAFSLMQKFVDLNSLGTKLKIVSAFAVDHMKGFVFIEADKQYDINEACQGIPGIYATRVAPVPNSEVYHLFSVRSRSPEISEGMWARIKGGNYKGDLAQVVAVNNTRKKVTVKLIPRIDLQALAAKFGGGYSRQKIAVAAPRLISSSELEEFRPLIQFKRDRDTGKVFEVLDGLMLKDGYVYKKVSPDSLSLWGVVPTEEELLKFVPSDNHESNDLEWLNQLYGDKKKKRPIRADKGGGKGESSSGSGVGNGFELYDLVCFGKKDFGVIVGMDKDDIYKILKESSDGPVAVTLERHEIKSGLFDLKLSAQDQHSKTILVNDTVKVLEGPSKDKQGIVKHIYRGIVFLYDGNVEENGGYFTCKSNMCEKVKLAVVDCSGKDSEPGPLVFEDQPSSPRSPLSPKKPWQARENNRESNRGDNNNMFSIGQTLRIRIGPLKGYLCRVIALRRSDVTVKLDSQQKVLTVKCEHLSEVQGKSTAVSTSGDPNSSSSKPFDLLGTEGSSGGWMNGVGTSTGGGGGWNAGGTSSERDAWSSNPAPSFLKPESTPNPFSSKGAEDTAWETKSNSNQNSSWGAAVKTGIASNPDQSGGWGNGGRNWGQAENKSVGDDNQNSNWNNIKPNNLDGNQPAGLDSKSNWNTTKASEKESSGWNNVQKSTETSTGWSGWKSGTSGVKEVGNPAGTSDIDANQDAGWKNKPNKDGWNAGKASDCSAVGFSEASGWKEGLGEETRGGSNWGNKKFVSSSSAVAENNGSKWGEASNLSSVSGEAGLNHGNGWGQRSSTKSGNENQNSQWSSGHTAAESGNQDSNLDKKSNWNSGNSGNLASDPKISNWNSGSGNSNQGNNGNWNSNKSSWGAGNAKKNSSWSSEHTDPGNPDSNQGKKSNWNPVNSGNQASDPNNSNWNSGSGDSNKNSNWGNKNKNSNWSSGHSIDPVNQDSNWGKKSNWNSGAGDTNQNTSWKSNSNWNTGNASSNDKLNGEVEGSNENSDGVGGGNWRGGYQGRGNFRARGFWGRGERGGFGDRGERGGRGGFGGRGRGGSDGGRGCGRRDQFSGSQSWNQNAGNKDRQSWSQGNADTEPPSWSQGGGSKQSWSQGNADTERPNWSQGGGSKQSWSSSSDGGNDNWHGNGSRQTTEASWKKSTTEETNVQNSGWNKGSSSNTTPKSWDNQETTGWKGSGVSGNGSGTGDLVSNWGQSSAADKGQSSSWKESTDGAAGSWGKKNDEVDKGGW